MRGRIPRNVSDEQSNDRLEHNRGKDAFMPNSSLDGSREVVPGVPIPDGLETCYGLMWWRVIGAMKRLPECSVDMALWDGPITDPEVCLVDFLSPMIYRGRGLSVRKGEEFRKDLSEVIRYMVAKKQVYVWDGRWYLAKYLRSLQRQRRTRDEKLASAKANRQLRVKAKKRKKTKKCVRVQARQRRTAQPAQQYLK